MFVSLYRKFRPDSFDKIVRQEHIVRVLKNQIEQDAVGHAYLFCGPRGTGKTSVARIFARAINCTNPQNGSPCGVCDVCRALSKESLDITEIDAASNNGVNEMRDLREKVQYPPVNGKYKVYIVDEVHMLTDSAFNALLKTLEEPPAHAVFLLATTEPHKIPATILSRCMRLDFKLIPEEDLSLHLEKILNEIGKPYEKEAVRAIARAGAGSDRDMLSIAEMCLAYGDTLTLENVNAVLGFADFSGCCELCEAMLAADMPRTLSLAEQILSEGKAVGALLRDLLEMLNRVAVVRACKNAERLLSLPKDDYLRVEAVAKNADPRAILRATEILVKTETDLKLVSSPRILLETALLKIALPQADESVDALLVRLNLLEKNLRDPSAAFPAQIPAQRQERKEVSFKNESAPRAEPSPFDDVPPPAEWDDPFSKAVIKSPQTERMERAEENQSEPVPRAKEGDAAPSAMTAEYAYGNLIKLLRKSSKSGVLRALCAELSPRLEGEKLVLLTESETVSDSLNRQEHAETLKTLLSEIGIQAYEVRLKTAEKADLGSAIDELKRDFPDYPIEIK